MEQMIAEQAIQEIQYYMNHDSYIDAPSNDACKLAIAALEKQMPRKPILDKLDLSNQGIDWLKYSVLCTCPVCNKALASYDNTQEKYNQVPYCKYCGQALDWTE